MVKQKPLPALPSWAVLSVDARRHRARLIRQFLSEIREHGVENLQENWAVAFEEALDELGWCLTREKWLDGLKRWREQQRALTKSKQGVGGKAESRDTAGSQKSKTEGENGLNTSNEFSEKRLESTKQLPTTPSSSSELGRRLLLCVSPPSDRHDLPAEDSGFSMIPANISCSFSSGTYALQDNSTETPTTLFGNKEADMSQLVGGTFYFKGITSLSQHEHLFRVLRLATYVHLAVTLEQHLLVDSDITLTYPQPKIQSPLPDVTTPPTPTEEKIKKPPPSFLPSILSLFSPRSMMYNRSKTIMPLIGPDIHQLSPPIPYSRPSLDSSRGGLANNLRFSILGSATRPAAPITEAQNPPESKPIFTDTLAQIEASADLLSTSPGVRFDPPSLIVDLAAREKEHSVRRLRGDERLGLTSILGWEGKEQLARGMTGSSGFLRQQGIEVLKSRFVPGVVSASDPQPMDRAVCGRATLRTYRYYDDGGDDGVSLGATIKDLVDSAGDQCDNAGCKHPRGLHETRFIHGGMRISLDVKKRKDDEQEPVSASNDIEMWESCNACDARSTRRKMSDGTYLLPFGKYLELLVYSATLGAPNPHICPHTDRLERIRHFGTSTHTVSFTCAAVEDIFELRVPRLQMTRSERTSSESTQTDLRASSEGDDGDEEEQEKRKLRKEIKLWWEGVADYMDKLENTFIASEELDSSSIIKYKALPRLPSTDDHYAYFSSPSPPHTIPGTPRNADKPLPDTGLILETPPRISAPPPTPAQQSPSSLIDTPLAASKAEQKQSFLRLSSLRHTFQRTEQSLYAQLARTPFATLNDVRCSFIASARGAEKRLYAWQKKHLAGSKIGKDRKGTNDDIAWTGAEEPEWWKFGYHALPGSNVIVREDDLGSIIAYTLSTTDYQRELTYISSLRQASSSQPTPPPHTDTSPPTTSSFFSAAMSYKLFTSSTDAQPDPDHDDVTWNAPELFSAVISRKEHPRDSANALLSLREVLRHQQKSPALDPSRFGSLGRGQAPPSAWAKPDVQISKSEADGVISADGPDTAGKILHEFDSVATADSSRPTSRASGSIMSAISNDVAALVETNVHSGKASSVISVESDATAGKETQSGDSTPKTSAVPLPPPKDERDVSRPRDVSNSTTPSSFTSSLTSGFSNAMKYVLHSTGNLDDTPRSASPFSKSPHGLLSLDNAGIDERPHIKYDWTIGKRLKFSCTVYYAKQFDLLRRRCGVDDIYIKSLRQSTNWAADGGKSRSNFWKTSDERFIIKTLVDAWNVADLQVLIDLAPSYFRYIDSTASKATVLAKMMGFYTIEIRNLETGNVQTKADLLVMENLFYNQQIGRTFDLKGIQGRKVKPSSSVKVAHKTQTLFDGEWIEGQQKALVLIRPHSKQVLRAAIRSDAEFLAKSNIMDYSLLIGVNEGRKEITCGLVDTIGSYTFAKTLEYKAKQGLNSGKEVTVIPPAEYQERFVSALEGYFLACPDKWSKPMDESKIISDVNLLPSVL